MPSNDRVYFAIKDLAIAPVGTTTFLFAHAVKGLQSVGQTARINNEQIFQFGQSETYDFVENVPDVEYTLEKVLDGHPLIYHLATAGAPTATLHGRAKQRSSICYAMFSDLNDNASGTPIAEVYASGLLPTSVSYNFPVTGPFTESVTLTGNDQIARTSGFMSSGFFDGISGADGTLADETTPFAPEGVNSRRHFVWVASSGVLPTLLPYGIDGVEGIASDGTNPVLADGNYRSRVQSIRVQANLGRENLQQLGRNGPYARFLNNNVEVTCDIEIISNSGNLVQVTQDGVLGNGKNTSNQTIFISTQEGTRIDLGSKCRLTSATYGGGNTNGGNDTVAYQYRTFNKFTVTHPNDPRGSYAP